MLGQRDEALSAFEQGLAIQPMTYEAWLWKALRACLFGEEGGSSEEPSRKPELILPGRQTLRI